MKRAGALTLATVSMGALTVLATAGPAAADPTLSPMPPDIQKMFNGPALADVQKAAANYSAAAAAPTESASPGSARTKIVQDQGDEESSDVPDFSGDIQAASIHEVFDFSADFSAGKTTDDPVTPTGEWISSIERDAQPLGTMMVDKTAAGAVEVGHFDTDVDQAKALGGIKDGELFILEERTGEMFALSGTTVRALNDSAKVELPDAAPISALQKVVAARIAAGNAADEGIDAPVGGGGPVARVERTRGHLTDPLTLVGLTLIAGGGAVVIYRVRVSRRRHAPAPLQP